MRCWAVCCDGCDCRGIFSVVSHQPATHHNAFHQTPSSYHSIAVRGARTASTWEHTNRFLNNVATKLFIVRKSVLLASQKHFRGSELKKNYELHQNIVLTNESDDCERKRKKDNAIIAIPARHDRTYQCNLYIIIFQVNA